MKLSTCRRHPLVRFPWNGQCAECRQELHDAQYGNPAAQSRLAAKVRAALGLPTHAAPIEAAGETATRVSVWDVRQLDTIYARTGGTVTVRPVERTLSDGSTYNVTEITVTFTPIEVGRPVEVFTDFDAAFDADLDLPILDAMDCAILDDLLAAL